MGMPSETTELEALNRAGTDVHLLLGGYDRGDGVINLETEHSFGGKKKKRKKKSVPLICT